MSKYKKAKEKGLINLANGIDLLVERNLTNMDLQVAIGMLVQMFALAEKDYGKVPKEKLKDMINAYVDKIYDEVTK